MKRRLTKAQRAEVEKRLQGRDRVGRPTGVYARQFGPVTKGTDPGDVETFARCLGVHEDTIRNYCKELGLEPDGLMRKHLRPMTELLVLKQAAQTANVRKHQTTDGVMRKKSKKAS